MRRADREPGTWKTRRGGVRVRDPQYLAWLHRHLLAGSPLHIWRSSNPLLDVGPVELHHFAQERRENDAFVIPIHRALHTFVTENPERERNFRPAWFIWAANMYWKYLTREADGSLADSEAFARWVLQKAASNELQP